MGHSPYLSISITIASITSSKMSALFLTLPNDRFISVRTPACAGSFTLHRQTTTRKSPAVIVGLVVRVANYTATPAPVPLIAEVPVKVRFSTLAASVQVTLACTRSVPSPRFSVAMSEVLTFSYILHISWCSPRKVSSKNEILCFSLSSVRVKAYNEIRTEILRRMRCRING